MAITRRWLQSAVEQSRKPQPKMPWQQRKLAVILSSAKTSGNPQGAATA